MSYELSGEVVLFGWPVRQMMAVGSYFQPWFNAPWNVRKVVLFGGSRNLPCVFVSVESLNRASLVIYLFIWSTCLNCPWPFLAGQCWHWIGCGVSANWNDIIVYFVPLPLWSWFSWIYRKKTWEVSLQFPELNRKGWSFYYMRRYSTRDIGVFLWLWLDSMVLNFGMCIDCLKVKECLHACINAGLKFYNFFLLQPLNF